MGNSGKRDLEEECQEEVSRDRADDRKAEFHTFEEGPRLLRVADSWLVMKKLNLRHSTFEQYHGHLEHHLKPHFGETKINRITYDSVEQFIIHLSKKVKTKPRGRNKEIPEKEKIN